MEYLMIAIVLGMLIWAGIEIVQTIRNWEPNRSEFNKKMQAETGQYEANGFVGNGAIDLGVQATGNVIDAAHCAAEGVSCEAGSRAIGHAIESLSHFIHH
jgi:hypothetical protein